MRNIKLNFSDDEKLVLKALYNSKTPLTVEQLVKAIKTEDVFISPEVYINQYIETVYTSSGVQQYQITTDKDKLSEIKTALNIKGK